MDHGLIKLIHVSCVTLSLCGFLFRATLMLRHSPWLHVRITRTIPHFVDATLLFSGIWMAINIQQYPLVSPWLTAKLVALVCYIVLGALALRGKSFKLRLMALVGALLCYAYLVAVALTRSPWVGLHP